jgi:Na+-translocating ferredoxin:NAD+ oxidoreductase RnfD subunit
MIQEIKKYLNLKNALTQFFLFLSVFTLISLWDLLFFTKQPQLRGQYILELVTCIAGSLIFYTITKKHLGVVQTNPLNFLVTCMIIFLLIHPSNPLIFYVMAIMAAWLGKYFFRYNNQPIFNPAALGLTITYVVTELLVKAHLLSTGLLVSWWGADMQQKFVENNFILHIALPVLLLFGFFYCAERFKKGLYSATFFLSYLFAIFAYNLYTQNSSTETVEFVSAAFFNSTAFLALVMLPEPKTSPSFPRQKVVIGFIAGIATFVYTFFLQNIITEPFLATVLTANLLTLLFKQRKLLI